MSPFKPLLTVVAALPMFLAGCAGLDLWSGGKLDYPTTSQKKPAAQIIAMWRPAQGTGLKGRPTRGFAGQVMFFTARDAIPAVVNGKIRIYLFDDQGTKEEQSKPIHQFDFTPDAWNTHAEYSKLGPAYNIFIPYTNPGGHEANCTLSIRLTPADGGPVLFSEEAHITLDGPKRKETERQLTTGESKSRKRKAKPVKQSYEISHETIVPKRVKLSRNAKRRSRRGRNAAKRADHRETWDDEHSSHARRVNYESSDDEAEFDEQPSRRTRRTSRRIAKRHPLEERDEFEDNFDNDEEFFDNLEEEEDDDYAQEEERSLDRLIRKHRRRRDPEHTRYSPPDSISVDLSQLHGHTYREEEAHRGPRGRPRHTRNGHPLTEQYDAGVNADWEEITESAEEDRTFTIRTNR